MKMYPVLNKEKCHGDFENMGRFRDFGTTVTCQNYVHK